MIIQLENVILISQNSKTMLLLLLLLLDYFGARTNFALAYPAPQTRENNKDGEPLPEERNCSPPNQIDKETNTQKHEENFQITITTPQIHN